MNILLQRSILLFHL